MAQATNTRKRAPMSDDHKAALAVGRDHGRTVRRYLEALESHKPRRGRKRSPESMEKRLSTIEEQMAGADPLKRLQLIQERLDLEAALQEQEPVDLEALEKEFVAVAASYSERKGISYTAWRHLGVPAPLLAEAGIPKG